MFNEEIRKLSSSLVSRCQTKQINICIAESCTGGLLSSVITANEGASRVFERAYVSYSNQAKAEDLGVSFEILEKYGAVSENVAKAMATGALRKSPASLALAVTGVAGPTGGTEAKPVGLVYIACIGDNFDVICRNFNFDGDRNSIRLSITRAALQLLLDIA